MRIDNSNIVWIHIDALKEHPDNPRKEIGDVSELAASIKAKGIMQNLTVVPGKTEGAYTVIIGHRRLNAAREAGVRTLPCVIVEMTEQEQIETMLLENMQRVDLTAYEQAQGFQMMIDFGDSIEDISEKTGFSETTIRRRIKMNELDAAKLKEVSERQISIADLDKLSKIEDIEVRNRVLCSIGTNNFDAELQQALKKQMIEKMMPKALNIIKKIKARKIHYSETYGGKYSNLFTVYLNKWDGDTIPLKEDEDRKLYYYIDERNGSFSLYVERPRPAPIKKSKAEIEKEKKVAQAWDDYRSKTALAYTLRKSFIDNLSVGKNNIDTVLRGAAMACALNVVTYVQTNSSALYAVLGLDDKPISTDLYAEAIKKVRTSDRLSVLTKVIYTAFGDREEHGYSSGGYRYEFPKHGTNYKLDELYSWLCSLGYKMSDEEKALQDGTHEVFHRGEDGCQTES